MIDIDTVALLAAVSLAFSLWALVRSAKRPANQPIAIPVPKLKAVEGPMQVDLDPALLIRIRLSEIRLRRAQLEKTKREELDALEDTRLLVDLLLHRATPQDAESEQHLVETKRQAKDRIDRLRHDLKGLNRLEETLAAQCDELTDAHHRVAQERMRDRSAFVVWVDKGMEVQLKEARDSLTEAVKRRERMQALVPRLTGATEVEPRPANGKAIHTSLVH